MNLKKNKYSNSAVNKDDPIGDNAAALGFSGALIAERRGITLDKHDVPFHKPTDFLGGVPLFKAVGREETGALLPLPTILNPENPKHKEAIDEYEKAKQDAINEGKNVDEAIKDWKRKWAEEDNHGYSIPITPDDVCMLE